MLLITPQEIISHAFSSREIISPNAFRPSKIDIAQEHFIRPRIGDKLFDQMQQGEFRDFNDYYIKPSLAYFVRYTMIEDLSVAIGDNGTVIYSGGTINEDQTENSNQNSDLTKDLTEKTTQTDVGSKTETDTHNTSNLEIGKTSDTTAAGSLSKTTQKDTDVAFSFRGDVETVQNETSTKNATTNQQDNEIIKRLIENQNTRATQNYQPASKVMVHRLQIRALSDANVLVNKAVRYLQSHPEIFGTLSEITPSSFYF